MNFEDVKEEMFRHQNAMKNTLGINPKVLYFTLYRLPAKICHLGYVMQRKGFYKIM